MAVFKDKNKTKDGRSWYFSTYKKDFEGNNNLYKSKRFLTKREAEEAERLFLMKRENPIHKEFYLVAKDYLEDCYKTENDSTAYSYENYYMNHIEPFFKKYYMDDITIPILKEWKEYMNTKNLALNTLNKAYLVLNNILNYGVKNYGISANFLPILGRFKQKKDKVIKDEEKLRYITFKEFNQFVSVIDEDLWKTFFTFLFYTGMRKGEVQALNWNDIDFDKSEIIVNKSLTVKTKKSTYIITTTKNKQNRKIKMNTYLKETLLTYKNKLKQYKDFSENWFVFGNSRFLPQMTIDRMKHKYFELSGVKEITIHEFRHSHVSLLVNEYVKQSKEKNMKVDTAKFFLMMSDRMGHTIDVMQRTYMHLFPTIQDELVDILDNLGNK